MANDKSITVSRTIDASAKDIFDVLTLPARHAETDASGFVVSAENTERIQQAGDVFVMNIHGDHMGGDYKMHNHVTGLVDNRLVAWKPANDDDPKNPGGWEWKYELEPVDENTTEVTLTYNWEDVTDKDLLGIFPMFDEKELEASLGQLASAVA